MPLITLFTISAIALAFLVGFRSLELALGRDIIPMRVRDAIDTKVVRVIATVRRALRSIKFVLVRELTKIPIFILHVFVAFWAWVLKYVLRVATMVQGRGDGKTRGVVAAHLDAVRAFDHQLHK